MLEFAFEGKNFTAFICMRVGGGDMTKIVYHDMTNFISR